MAITSVLWLLAATASFVDAQLTSEIYEPSGFYTYGSLTPSASDAAPTGPTAVGSPATVYSPSATATPCAAVQDVIDDWTLFADSDTPNPLVPAKLAHECLTSVPFMQGDGTGTGDALLRLIEFQSNIIYLKNPPDTYRPGNPALDLKDELEVILSKTQSSDPFDNQYLFEQNVSETLAKAYDGHLAFLGPTNLLTFAWQRDPRITLASVVTSDSALPNIFCVADLNRTDVTASPVTEVNGQNATEYFLEESNRVSLHDPDARWNSMFYSAAGGPWYGYFITPSWYPGEITTITFENGSKVTYENNAQLYAPEDWLYISSGEDFYARFVNYSSYYYSKATVSPANLKDEQSLKKKKRPIDSIKTYPFRGLQPQAITSPPTEGGSNFTKRDVPYGYPEPFITHSDPGSEDVLLSGYFEPYDGNDSGLAILALQTFYAAEDSDFLEFQSIVSDFLRECRSRNTQKIIVDVSWNGGGVAILAYDVFKQFFPTLNSTTTSRYRALDGYDFLGPKISADYYLSGSPLDYHAWVDENYNTFPSWSSLYTPQVVGQDSFTSALQWDLCNAATVATAPYDYIPSGCSTGNRPAQPFASTDIVLLTNGICASACAIFKNMMASRGDVPAIALGGRPQNGPMQAVGGTRGGIVLSSLQIDAYVQELVPYYTDEELGRAGVPISLPINAYMTFNSQNQYREGSETPLQFEEDPAGCRLFYTGEMVLDVTKVWSAVADAAWGGEGGGLNPAACVQGSDVEEVDRQGATGSSGGSGGSGSGGSGSGGSGNGGSGDGDPQNAAGKVEGTAWVIMLVAGGLTLFMTTL